MDEFNVLRENTDIPVSEEPAATKKVIGVKKAYGHFTLLFSALVAMVIVTTVFQLVAMFCVNYYAPQLANESWYIWALSAVPMYCVGLPVTIIILLFAERDTGDFEKKKISFGKWLKLFCIACAFMYAGNLLGIIVTAVTNLIPGANSGNMVGEMLADSPVWISFAVTVICAPLAEEFLFRKLLFDRMSAYGEKLAVFLSGLAFGLFHGNFSQFFYAFFLGLLFGYIYVKTKNIWYTITMHMVINAINGVLMSYLAGKVAGAQEALGNISGLDSMEALSAIAPYFLPSLMLMLVSLLMFAAAICGAVFFFKGIKNVRLEACKYEIEKKKVFFAAYANPGFIIFVLICAFTFIQSIFGAA